MNTLSFAGDMARLQRAIAESHDQVVRRGIVFDTLNLQTGEWILELGSGGGYYTHEAPDLSRRRAGSALSTSAPIRLRQCKLAAPSSVGSSAARRIFQRRRTGTPRV